MGGFHGNFVDAPLWSQLAYSGGFARLLATPVAWAAYGFGPGLFCALQRSATAAQISVTASGNFPEVEITEVAHMFWLLSTSRWAPNWVMAPLSFLIPAAGPCDAVEMHQMLAKTARLFMAAATREGGGGGVPTDELIAASAPREGYRPMLELGGTSADAR